MYPHRMTVEAVDREIARWEKTLAAFSTPAIDPVKAGRVAHAETALRELKVKRAGAVKNGYYRAA